jgi:hypothetical protein
MVGQANEPSADETTVKELVLLIASLSTTRLEGHACANASALWSGTPVSTGRPHAIETSTQSTNAMARLAPSHHPLKMSDARGAGKKAISYRLNFCLPANTIKT